MRTVTPLPLPGTSTTTPGTFSEANGVGTMTMKARATASAACSSTTRYRASTSTSAGNNEQRLPGLQLDQPHQCHARQSRGADIDPAHGRRRHRLVLDSGCEHRRVQHRPELLLRGEPGLLHAATGLHQGHPRDRDALLSDEPRLLERRRARGARLDQHDADGPRGTATGDADSHAPSDRPGVRQQWAPCSTFPCTSARTGHRRPCSA